MKKFNILTASLLVGITLAPTSINVYPVSASSDINLSSSQINQFKNSLSNVYQLESTLTFSYDYKIGNSSITSLKVIDTSSPTRRYHALKYNDVIVDEYFVFKGSDNSSNIESLSLKNVVQYETLLTSDNELIKFDNEFGSCFANLVKLSDAQINNYFEVSQLDNNNLLLKATPYAYAAITSKFNQYFNDYNTFVWDTSFSNSIENVEIIINSDGIPSSMKFDKISKDNYGGVRTHFSSTFSYPVECKKLLSHPSVLDQDIADTFINNMEAFQAKLDKGNFTETFTIGQAQYSNYYQLDSNVDDNLPPMMLTDNVLYVDKQGDVYTGVAKQDNTYFRIGVFTDSNFYDRLDATTYNSIKNVIPNISNISSDFFTYSNNIYTFDLASFMYADYDFSVDILEAIIGLADAMVVNIGLYMDGSTYNFKTLNIAFDNENNPYGLLTFISGGYEISTLFQFSNVGTTDLTNVSALAPALNVLKNN